MKFNIDFEVFKRVPDLLSGIIVLQGINNRSASKDPYGILKQVMKEIKKADLEESPSLKFWNKAFKKEGINPRNFPPSIVAMAERIAAKKELPSVNPAVDLYNAVSLKTLIPMGGYDVDTIKKDVEIRLSKAGDSFVPMGKDKKESIEPGQIAFASGKDILCARWAWRQDNKHKVSDKTKNLLIRVEGYGRDREELKEALDEVARLIKKHCGGQFKTFILSKDNPSLDLSFVGKGVKQKKLSDRDMMIDNIINRGTVDVIVREELEQKLYSRRKLKIKFGIDPTGSDLHLGHMVPVKKLAEFQKLGHHIQLLFGNFTGQIGDPTGKSEVRKKITQKDLEKNAKTYVKQVSKVLDVNKIEVVWNAEWLSMLNFADVTRLSSLFTVGQMMERDMFQERIKKEQPIYVHEFMYPLMQGYDSVALMSDVEIGGTEQTFNLYAGRTIQKAHGQKPQSIVTVPILEGLDGKIKMGKSTGNYVGVMEKPEDQYGKIMSIPDNLIFRYFELATEVPLAEIGTIRDQIAEGMNPRDAKMRLAREIVTLYHNDKKAKKAEEHFIKLFQKQEVPDDMPSVKLKKGQKLLDLIADKKLVASKSEARRMMQQNAVSFNDEKITDIEFTIGEKGIIKVGKRRFLEVK